jgi:tetratricopeptide (TPR) repeat protein
MPTNKRHPGGVSAIRAIVLILAALAGLACNSLTNALHSSSGTEAYRLGLEAYNQGDYEQALAHFGDAIKADPNLAAAYYARGEIYYLQGAYQLAVADYGSAIDRKYAPAAQAYSARADAHIALGEFDASGGDYAEAYRLDHEFFQAYYPDRQKAYATAIELHPELPGTYAAHGRVSFLLQDYQAAVDDYTAAIELKPEPLSPAYFARGLAYQGVGDYPPAIADFTRVIELEPNSTDAYDARARAHIRQEEYDQALADLAQSVVIDPNFARGHNNLCWYGSLLGHAAEVMQSCEQAVALAPTAAAYRDSRGVARAMLGDLPGAIEDFEYYVAFMKSRGLEDKDRTSWIAQLKAGVNPFDRATLKALLSQ